ncbi:MAG TPA: phage tail assembly chaperone [Albidovulum sp.]|uniref:rcc01693 family protein n=1 Tax=Albidovulum sp. TaxID=1872424 RepID=UPI002D0E0B35|nr:phage tail assembly chaperone [Albidovulum sp.]
MSAFDWPGLMRAGIGGLGLGPEEFWRLTPAELVLMLGDPTAVAPLGRARLGELVRAWPDKIKEDGDGTDGRAGQPRAADGGA